MALDKRVNRSRQVGALEARAANNLDRSDRGVRVGALLRVCLLSATSICAGCALESDAEAVAVDASIDAASRYDDGDAVHEASEPKVVAAKALVAELALPACDSYTEYLHHTSGGIRHWTRLPTIGFNSHAVLCTLRRGNSGRSAIRALQASMRCSGQALLPDGRVLEIDGDFGGDTEGAVRRVQAAAGITNDGIYGPETSRYINFATFADAGWFSGCERD